MNGRRANVTLSGVKSKRKSGPARNGYPAPAAILLVALGIAAGVGAWWLWSQRTQRTAAIINGTNTLSTNAAAVAPASMSPTNLAALREEFITWVTNQTDASELLNSGTRFLEQNRLGEAILCYARARELRPNDEEANFNLAFACAKAGRVEDAIHYYTEALKSFPEYVEAHNNLGNLFLQQRRYSEAIQSFTEALKSNPEHAPARNSLGRALAEQGETREAITHFLEAVRLNPDYVEAHFNLGTAYLALGRTNEAVNQMGEVLRLRPGFAPAMQFLSRVRRVP